MTLLEEIASLISEDALEQAAELAKARVKAAPTDKDARHLYIDLLVISADYERADNQCGIAVTFSPDDAMGFSLLRNQLRGMAARDAWFKTGAVPNFPHGPTELDRLALQIGLFHRLNEAEKARSVLDELESMRGERDMVWNGRAIADFRDLDDRIPHALEVITTGGAYLWVDFAKVSILTVEPLARPRDFAFRRAELSLVDGASASVLVPAIYHGTPASPKLLLGRETEWQEEAGGISTGRGQRCYLAGDDLVSFHDAATLELAGDINTRRAVNG
jgi:type VI secretion system protein ImpE